MTHVDLQEAIPDYLADRLAQAPRHSLERHLEECDECAELVESWKLMAPELRRNGAAIFQPHPEAARLRTLARGAGDEDWDAAAHVASCPSCALEVDAWGSAAVGEFERTASVRPITSARTGAWWGIAATLAATTLLVFTWRATRLPSPSGPALEWSGAPRMLVLDGAERGGSAQPHLALEANQPYAVLGAQLVLPVSAPDERIVRFSLAGGDGRERWGVELRADEIRARLRSEGAVMLMIPRRALPAGAASLRAVSNGERLWEVAFVTDLQRQSPDATNAPQ